MEKKLAVGGLADVESIEDGDRLVGLRARHVWLRIRIDDHRGNVVEDVAIVVGGRVRDVDDIDAGESLLRLGLRGLDHGRRFVDVDRFLYLLQMIESNFDFGRAGRLDGGDS